MFIVFIVKVRVNWRGDVGGVAVTEFSDGYKLHIIFIVIVRVSTLACDVGGVAATELV